VGSHFRGALQWSVPYLPSLPLPSLPSVAVPYIVTSSFNNRYFPIFSAEIENSEPGRPLVDLYRRDGRMLTPEQIPKWARRVSRGTEMPDVFHIAAAWCISERFKELIEHDEPDIHGFYPVPLFQKDGSEIAVRFFLLDVRQVIDAVVPEASDTFLSRLPDGRSVIQFNDYARVAVDLSKVAGRHMWRGRQHLVERIFMSDALVAALQRAKIRKFQFYKTLEIA
jgi:hypothetical protein